MRYPIKEGTNMPYSVPKGTKVARDGSVISPKSEEKGVLAEYLPEAPTNKPASIPTDSKPVK